MTATNNHNDPEPAFIRNARLLQKVVCGDLAGDGDMDNDEEEEGGEPALISEP